MGFENIGSIAQQIRGVTYSGNEVSSQPRPGYLPILRAGNITDSGLIFDDLVYVPTERVSDKQMLHTNDIIVAASSGSLDVVGKAAQVTTDFRGSFGAFCKVLRPSKNVHPKYFAYYFKTGTYRAIISARAAGANINNLRNDDLDSLVIPIPHPEKQKEISSMLEKAESALEKRREAIRLLDDFIKSAFLEMFGDPADNSKKLPIVKCRDIATHVSSGSTPLGGEATYLKKGITFIRSQNVQMNHFDFSDVAYIGENVHNQMKRTWVKFGDVLLNITGASIGRVAYYKGQSDKANVNQHVCIIRLDNSKSLPEYLSFLISMPNYQKKILSRNSGATRQAFNFEQIKDFDIPLASLEKQKQFVAIVEKIDRLKQKMKSSETELQNLFGALMQKAFNGESS